MSIPSSIEYIDSARHFAAIVAGRADEIEERRRIPPDLSSALADAGLFLLLVPKSLGGAGLKKIDTVASDS